MAELGQVVGALGVILSLPIRQPLRVYQGTSEIQKRIIAAPVLKEGGWRSPRPGFAPP